MVVNVLTNYKVSVCVCVCVCFEAVLFMYVVHKTKEVEQSFTFLCATEGRERPTVAR